MGCPGNELGPPCSEALVSAKWRKRAHGLHPSDT
jgi:hypothetical protein